MKRLSVYKFQFKDLTKPLHSEGRHRSCVIRGYNKPDANKRFKRIYLKCEVSSVEKIKSSNPRFKKV